MTGDGCDLELLPTLAWMFYLATADVPECRERHEQAREILFEHYKTIADQQVGRFLNKKQPAYILKDELHAEADTALLYALGGPERYSHLLGIGEAPAWKDLDILPGEADVPILKDVVAWDDAAQIYLSAVVRNRLAKWLSRYRDHHKHFRTGSIDRPVVVRDRINESRGHASTVRWCDTLKSREADPGDVADGRETIAALLDDRQQAVIRGLAAGRSRGEIAAALGLSTKSVDRTRDAAYAILRERCSPAQLRGYLR